jgi:hypothetical protein
MREQYTLVGPVPVPFWTIWNILILRTWKDFSTQPKALTFRWHGIRLRRETQPTALPSDDNPRKAMTAFEAVSV